MSGIHANLMFWGFGLCVLAYGLLWCKLLAQHTLDAGDRRRGMPLLLAISLTVAWAVLGLLALFDPGWWRWSVAADIGRYAAWFVWIQLLFVGNDQHVPASGRAPQRVAWMRPVTALLPVAAGLTLAASTLRMTPEEGSPTLLFLCLMLLSVLGLVLVEQLFRNLPDDAVWSAKPISLGLAGVFLFDLFVFSQATLFQGLDPDAWSVRGLIHALLMPLMLLSTARHRHWMDKIRVSRKVVFHSATLVIVGAYLLFIAGVGYYVRFFGGDWGRALQLALVFVAVMLLVTLVLSRSLRARLRVSLGKHFFHYRYDYREEWLKFTHTLSGQAAPQEMGEHVVRGLADMLESPAGALWLKRPDEAVYRQVARWNVVPVGDVEPLDSPLMAFMQRTGWVVNLHEYAQQPQLYEHAVLPTWLRADAQAWLLVPLWLGADMLGFVVLSSPRTHQDVNWEVNDLLKTAGRQAASFLALMQSTEALLEARKFEAFSRMSAFVVHDLKNIVTQLSLMVKNAKRLSHNPEFQADMLMTVENSLERMRQLMLQLREGAAPGGTAVGVDLPRIAQDLAAAAQRRGRHVRIELPQRLSARGHADRLERVIGHLVNNALDATDVSQEVWLKLDRYGSHARVEVGDNGSGMSEAFIQERLFKPFQTTKEAGMGIGAYESFQYVQELGGKVTVNSEVGQGTVVTLLLPLMDTVPDSDLHPTGTS